MHALVNNISKKDIFLFHCNILSEHFILLQNSHFAHNYDKSNQNSRDILSVMTKILLSLCKDKFFHLMILHFYQQGNCVNQKFIYV